ncbi:MAG TPA: protein kinase, partial [Candidatus Saccharimonadales bacterium]|nr:protein kinase [Candidatus Saccharimonadales bacterium]
MPDSNPLQPGQKFGNGRFVLVRFLGRGGMGEVWLAQDERLDEPVALKFLPSEVRADPVALDDLRRETARSHKLTHPNIVRIHDLHEDADGTAFIVMEYVGGPTLAAVRLEQPGRVVAWDYLRPLV